MTAEAGPESLSCGECRRAYGPEDLAHFGVVLICAECKDRYVQKLREGVPVAPLGIYATFWSRAVAWLIDAIVLMVVGSIIQFALLGTFAMRQPQAGMTPDALGSMLGVLGLVFILDTVVGCSYEAIFVSSALCATPGKLALEIKVVRPNGGRVGLGRAVARYFGKRLNTLTAGIGYILAAFDNEKRGLHDILCDTRVIRRQI
ncbi:MAG TPA: RDD family protein [Bryobacteraceae bacterium]|nr:RDD family protein [Bryobacteraceae bacterium]